MTARSGRANAGRTPASPTERNLRCTGVKRRGCALYCAPDIVAGGCVGQLLQRLESEAPANAGASVCRREKQLFLSHP